MDDELTRSLEPLHLDAWGWARHCCVGIPVDPDDVLQIAYLKVIAGKARPSGKGSIKTWWFGVIRLTTKEELRRRRFQESLVGRLLRLVPAEGDEAPSILLTEPDDSIHGLKVALTKLPQRQSEVLHLVFYQEFSIAEASVALGISLGAARTHYERGKARLRELLTSTQHS